MKTQTILIVALLIFSSCGMSKLTTEQQQELIKIDKEMSKLWNEYDYKTDSLWIERNRVINLNKTK
tara:strand:+ start:3042 stop:3239 length:198 start_codon:yes stop_codon:yes gene_type:complete